jgi:hypothetical protein
MGRKGLWQLTRWAVGYPDRAILLFRRKQPYTLMVIRLSTLVTPGAAQAARSAS